MIKIKFLKNTLGNDIGDIVEIEEETRNDFYYFDKFGKKSHIEKGLEDVVFERIKQNE